MQTVPTGVRLVNPLAGPPLDSGAVTGSRPGDDERGDAVVDVVLLTDLAASDVPPEAGRHLAGALDARFAEATWRVRSLASAHRPAPGAIVKAATLLHEAREALLREDADVVVVLTDRVLELHGRRVRSHDSPVQQCAVLSLADAPEASSSRLVDSLADLVSDVLRLEGGAEDRATLRWLAEDDGAQEVEATRHAFGWRFRVLGRGAVLLVRQVHAAQPWLMTVHLSRTLVGASAAAFLAVVTPDFWMLADRMGVGRLVLLSVLVLVAGVAVLVLGGNLRERAAGDRSRRAVLMHNTAVWISAGIGVLSLFAALVAACVVLTQLVLPRHLVESTVGHTVRWPTMARIGVLTAVVSLVGSVFGAGLEEDDEIREATFGQ